LLYTDALYGKLTILINMHLWCNGYYPDFILNLAICDIPEELYPRSTALGVGILLVTQCTIVPIRKNIGSIKFISGEAAEPDMNFIDPICITNLS
jgi:hypothetical protein